MNVGICVHSAKRALVRSGTGVRQAGLWCSQHFNSSQKCSVRLRCSRHCTDPLGTSTPILASCVFIAPALCTGAFSCWNMFGLGPLDSVLMQQHTHKSFETTVCFQACGNSLGPPTVPVKRLGTPSN